MEYERLLIGYPGRGLLLGNCSYIALIHAIRGVMHSSPSAVAEGLGGTAIK